MAVGQHPRSSGHGCLPREQRLQRRQQQVQASEAEREYGGPRLHSPQRLETRPAKSVPLQALISCDRGHLPRRRTAQTGELPGAGCSGIIAPGDGERNRIPSPAEGDRVRVRGLPGGDDDEGEEDKRSRIRVFPRATLPRCLLLLRLPQPPVDSDLPLLYFASQDSVPPSLQVMMLSAHTDPSQRCRELYRHNRSVLLKQNFLIEDRRFANFSFAAQFGVDRMASEVCKDKKVTLGSHLMMELVKEHFGHAASFLSIG